MNDDTLLLSLQLLETIEMAFDHLKRGDFSGEVDNEKRILERFKAIKDRILYPATSESSGEKVDDDELGAPCPGSGHSTQGVLNVLTGEINTKDIQSLDHGLYVFGWKDGGTSLTSVGSDALGRRWFAPTNWCDPPSFDWDKVAWAMQTPVTHIL